MRWSSCGWWHASQLSVDGQELVEADQLFVERRGLQQRRLAPRLADQLQADRAAVGVEAAGQGDRGAAAHGDRRVERRARHVVLELLAVDGRRRAQVDIERR